MANRRLQSLEHAVSRLLQQFIVMFNLLQSLLGSLNVHFIGVNAVKTTKNKNPPHFLETKLSANCRLRLLLSVRAMEMLIAAAACSINVFEEKAVLMCS